MRNFSFPRLALAAEESEDEFETKDLVQKIENGVDDTKELRLNVQNLVDPEGIILLLLWVQ